MPLFKKGIAHPWILAFLGIPEPIPPGYWEDNYTTEYMNFYCTVVTDVPKCPKLHLDHFCFLGENLFERQKQRDRWISKQIFQPPNVCNSQGWTKLKLGAQSFIGICHMSGKDWSTQAIPCCLLG